MPSLILPLLASRWTRYGVLLAALAGAVLWYGERRERAGEATVQARWDESVRLQREATIRDQTTAVRRYEIELASGADLAPVSVRVCPPSYRITAPGAGEAPAAPAVLPDVLSRDIGGEIDALMREADAVSARLRAVQGLH